MSASVSSELYVRGVGLAVAVGLGVALPVGLAVGLGFSVWALDDVSVDGLMRGVEAGLMLGLSVGSSASALGAGVSFTSTVGPSVGAVFGLLTVAEQPVKRQSTQFAFHLLFSPLQNCHINCNINVNVFNSFIKKIVCITLFGNAAVCRFLGYVAIIDKSASSIDTFVRL